MIAKPKSRKYVFIGPTLNAAERPVADVEYHAPVQHGSLFSLDLKRGDIVLIVDGIYQNFAPLRHKEIIAHLAMGVRIFGAGSYGALRASELRCVGVVPFGKVAHAYCDGQILDDSEVAVLHSPDESHHRLTVPMVSVRFALATLVDQQLLSEDEVQSILNVLSNLHFTRRTLKAIRLTLAQASFARQAALLCRELSEKPDVKAEDARQAIRLIEQLPDEPEEDHSDLRWQTGFSKAEEFATRRVHTDHPLTHRQLSTFARLMDVSYPERHRRYVFEIVASSCVSGFTSAHNAFAEAGYNGENLLHSRFAAPTQATRTWSAAERVMVRTFRLSPGTQALFGLPKDFRKRTDSQDIAAGVSQYLSQKGWTKARAAEWKTRLMELYRCHSDFEFELCCMERGLLTGENALREASQFELARALDFSRNNVLAVGDV